MDERRANQVKVNTLGLADKFSELRKRFEEGNKIALLDAVALAARQRLIMPDWAAESFAVYNAENRIQICANGSRRPNQKGRHLKKAERNSHLSIFVYMEVQMQRAFRGATFDDGLFEAVGQKFGIGKTLTKDMYYSWRNHMRAISQQMKANT